jgi:hypothetical protein
MIKLFALLTITGLASCSSEGNNPQVTATPQGSPSSETTPTPTYRPISQQTAAPDYGADTPEITEVGSKAVARAEEGSFLIQAPVWRLPRCDRDLAGITFYSVDDNTLYYCTGETWKDQSIKGENGKDGERGLAGERGAAGERGPIGERGLAGLGCQVDNKGVVSCASGSYQIPAGPAGATGATGLKGDQGVQGVPGIVGPAGPKGDMGQGCSLEQIQGGVKVTCGSQSSYLANPGTTLVVSPGIIGQAPTVTNLPTGEIYWVDQLGTALGRVPYSEAILIEPTNSTTGEYPIILRNTTGYPYVVRVYYTSDDCTGTPILTSGEYLSRGADGQFYVARKAHQITTSLLLKSMSSPYYGGDYSSITAAPVGCGVTELATSSTSWVGVPYTLPPQIENAIWPAKKVQAP